MHPTIILLLIGLYACGQQPENKKTTVNPEAKKLNDSAVIVAMETGDYDRAISLLNQATTIDSNYFSAYTNKLSFLLTQKQYDKALLAARNLIRIKPNIPDYYMTIGILYHIKADNNLSQKYLSESLNRFNHLLDTMKSTNGAYSFTLMNKGLNLVFLGQAQKGNDIFKHLYATQKDEILREQLTSYMNKSKDDLLKEWMAPATATSNAIPN